MGGLPLSTVLTIIIVAIGLFGGIASAMPGDADDED